MEIIATVVEDQDTENIEQSQIVVEIKKTEVKEETFTMSLAAVNQHQSSSCIAHIQWLVVLVQHQDSAHHSAPRAYQERIGCGQ